MARDTFPFWPPSSPQRPATIAGRQSLFELMDLSVNQIPRGLNNEIPLRPAPLPRIVHPQLPVDPEYKLAGKTNAQVANLYTLFELTEQMDRASAVLAFYKVSAENG